MLECLTKVIEKIDTFQEDCSSLIFGLKTLLGENQVFKDQDFFVKQVDEEVHVYRGTDLVLTENNDGVYVEPKFNNNMKLVKEAMRYLKEASNGIEDGQQLGGMKPGVIGEDDTDLRSKIEKFLKQFPNPQDNMVHGLAKKLGVETDKIEEIFYQIASDSINSGNDEAPIDEDGEESTGGNMEHGNSIDSIAVRVPTKKKPLKEAIVTKIGFGVDGTEAPGQILKGNAVTLNAQKKTATVLNNKPAV